MKWRRFLFGGSLKKMTRQQWDYIGWMMLLTIGGGIMTMFVLDRLVG